ncbi:MAG: hypothetical protein NTW73_00415 [Candidatus Parcubacteria bacterium]|nr:hypothetical protein [Candidatus Parcubacteria bacterium]
MINFKILAKNILCVISGIIVIGYIIGSIAFFLIGSDGTWNYYAMWIYGFGLIAYFVGLIIFYLLTKIPKTKTIVTLLIFLVTIIANTIVCANTIIRVIPEYEIIYKIFFSIVSSISPVILMIIALIAGANLIFTVFRSNIIINANRKKLIIITIASLILILISGCVYFIYTEIQGKHLGNIVEIKERKLNAINDMDECDIKNNDLFERKKCYWDLINNINISRKDISMCDKFEYLDEKNTCYYAIAISVKDLSICNKIQGFDDIKSCNYYVTEKINEDKTNVRNLFGPIF